MEKTLLDKINIQVFKQFPYLKETQPTIKNNPDGTKSLKYSGLSKTANGMAIPLSVIIKATEDGKILQIKSSK